MKRFALRLVVLILCGAIVNITVAWYCAVRSAAMHVAGGVPNATEAARLIEPFNRNSAYVWKANDPGATLIAYDCTVALENAASSPYRESLLAWMSSSYIYDDKPIGDGRIEWRAGWPMLCLEGAKIVIASRSGSSVGGSSSVEFSCCVPLRLENQRLVGAVLPLLPIFPGFAINTIFYAAVLWLLCAFPFALRRRRRIKRGLCPKCAYPVGTSDVCTECGRAVEK